MKGSSRPRLFPPEVVVFFRSLSHIRTLLWNDLMWLCTLCFCDCALSIRSMLLLSID